ncbi:endoglucanase 3 [Apiospora kogelbergensis]|uniref:cellulase n=1 Tax=Apiospora kogelbergensis TaxID=1337665 RepID=A0AAW0QF97_9PEZI
MRAFVLSGAFAGAAVAAANGPWAQCGGNGWAGESTCVDGYTCTVSNEWYSQCLPGSAAPAPAPEPAPTTTLVTSTKAATSTAAAPTSTSGKGKLKWFGINQSVAEFGEKTLPGVWGKEFYFPSDDTIATLIKDGYNAFRVAFLMERLVPDKMTGPANAAYLANLTHTVDTITKGGAYAILDSHNYGRYYGNIITDASEFKAYWTTLATAFKGNDKVVFDTNNEWHDVDQSVVLSLNQAAIDAIRGAGATSQWIFAEGNSWTGAWHWNTTNDNLKALKDPQDKLAYEMHQYLDSDGSGTSADCVSADIGVQRIVGATEWLKQNGKKGIIGEFAGGANTQCQTAIKGMLDHMEANSDVWMGAVWWAGGPWWADYIFSFEPPSGTAYKYYNSMLKAYAP